MAAPDDKPDTVIDEGSTRGIAGRSPGAAIATVRATTNPQASTISLPIDIGTFRVRIVRDSVVFINPGEYDMTPRKRPRPFQLDPKA